MNNYQIQSKLKEVLKSNSYTINDAILLDFKDKIKKIKKETGADKRSSTSSKNGIKGGRPQIDVTSITEKFIEKFYRSNSGNLTLREHRGKWYEYNGKYYSEIDLTDIEKRITQYLQDTLKEQKQRVSASLIRDIIVNLKSFNFAGLPSTLDMPFWIDTNKEANNFFITDNGILDIIKGVDDYKNNNTLSNRLLTPHNENLFSTNGVNYKFNPNANCDMWNNYLEKVLPNKNIQLLLQQMFGLCLIAETNFNVFFILYGEGGTGKSVAIKVLQALLGIHNYSTVPFLSLGGQFYMKPLTTKLANIVSELPEVTTPEKMRFVEEQIKQITEGAVMQVEEKHKRPYSAKAKARLIYAGNTLPIFIDKTNAIWDRLIIIMFDVIVRGTTEDNKNLADDIIRSEMSGIINWALVGLAKLYINKSISEPEACKLIKESHRLKCDHTKNFLIENYSPDSNSHISTKDTYENYKNWARDNCFTPIAIGNFEESIKRNFKATYKTRINTNKRKITVWKNIIQK